MHERPTIPFAKAPLLVQIACREAGLLYHVDPPDITRPIDAGGTRYKSIAHARKTAMWVSRSASNELKPVMSYPEIGRAFNRDHTTVMSGINWCRMHSKTDEQLREQLAAMLSNVLVTLRARTESAMVIEARLDPALVAAVCDELNDPVLFPTQRTALEFVLADWLMDRRRKR
jgi:hypothetical protein